MMPLLSCRLTRWASASGTLIGIDASMRSQIKAPTPKSVAIGTNGAS
jgi:hypothetical protein